MSEDLKLKPTKITLRAPSGKFAGKAKAFVTLVFNNKMSVNGLKIIGGSKGLFVSWPSRKIGEDWVPFVNFPEDQKEYRNTIQNWIIAQYEKDGVTESTYKKNKPSNNSEVNNNNNDDDDDLPF